MKIVVTSFGSAGDFNPLLAIAAALARSGVDVTFVANPFYGGRIEASGCRFVAAGDYFDVFEVLEANARYFQSPSGALAIWRELVVPSVRAIYPVMLRTIREVGATAAVSHVLSYGGGWAAATAGVRSVIVTTTSSAWLSRHQPIVFANWRAPRPVQSLITLALRGMGGLLAGRVAGRLATDIGAPRLPDLMRVADLNLGLWPEWFRASADDDPPRSQTCGFVFDSGNASLPPEVDDFLSRGEAPVVAGFGSAASLHATDRYRAVASACARLRRRCLLIGASAEPVPADGQVLAVASAPYAKVFPRASVVLHHGGFGTCAEALRAGKPSVVTPFAFDQFDTAARLEAAGLGRWLRSLDALEATLEQTLCSEAMTASAARAAARISGDVDGAQRAVELIG